MVNKKRSYPGKQSFLRLKRIYTLGIALICGLLLLSVDDCESMYLSEQYAIELAARAEQERLAAARRDRELAARAKAEEEQAARYRAEQERLAGAGGSASQPSQGQAASGSQQGTAQGGTTAASGTQTTTGSTASSGTQTPAGGSTAGSTTSTSGTQTPAGSSTTAQGTQAAGGTAPASGTQAPAGGSTAASGTQAPASGTTAAAGTQTPGSTASSGTQSTATGTTSTSGTQAGTGSSTTPGTQPVVAGSTGANYVTSISGRSWKLVELRFADRNVVLNRNELTGSEVDIFTMTINNDRISGMGAPNRYFTAYQAGTNNSLIIQPIASTMMAAIYTDPRRIREAEYFQYLGKVKSWRINQNRLELTSADAANRPLIMVFSN